jgi:hypothetical protein
MNKPLFGIRDDLSITFSGYKPKYRHSQNPFVETLVITLNLMDDISKIEMIISHFKMSKSISMEFVFIKAPKKKTPKKERHSLSNLKPDVTFPFLTSESLIRVIQLQKFVKDGNEIRCEYSLEEQMETLVKLIKTNFEAILLYANDFAK